MDEITIYGFISLFVLGIVYVVVVIFALIYAINGRDDRADHDLLKKQLNILKMRDEHRLFAINDCKKQKESALSQIKAEPPEKKKIPVIWSTKKGRYLNEEEVNEWKNKMVKSRFDEYKRDTGYEY